MSQDKMPCFCFQRLGQPFTHDPGCHNAEPANGIEGMINEIVLAVKHDAYRENGLRALRKDLEVLVATALARLDGQTEAKGGQGK